MGRNDPGFVHNGPLAGLVAVCAGSDVMHPLGALVTGGVAGVIFVVAVHAGAEQMEDRRRARRLAAARPVRRLGRHRLRHLRRAGAGRHRRRELRCAACRYRWSAWAGRWPAASWSMACCARRWACASRRKRNTRAPTCRSTRSARRRSARSIGKLTAPARCARIPRGELEPLGAARRWLEALIGHGKVPACSPASFKASPASRG